MFPWLHCKEIWSHCNGLKLLRATMLFQGNWANYSWWAIAIFIPFFSNEGHLGIKIVIKRFEFWISHLTLNWHLINTIILLKKRGLMASAPPRNCVKYWNLENPIHCSSRDFKLDFFLIKHNFVWMRNEKLSLLNVWSFSV